MENRPPQQDPPRRPTPSARKNNGTSGSPTPPWLWLLLIGGFAIIFWQFMPKPETTVDYNPWFLDQVDTDNIKKLSIQGTDVRGELRKDMPYQGGSSPSSVMVHRFITYFPSENSIDPVINRLR
ncbi:MAG: ATP-dependent zinc metalloprotease FtsH, partial [Isosphaeraceae bacterium]